MLYLLEKANRIVAVSKVLVKYRKRQGSITQTKSLQNEKDYIFALNEREKYVAAHIPVFFSEGTLIRIRDRHFRKMMIKCAELRAGNMSLERKVFADRFRSILISRNKKHQDRYSLLTQITFILFKYCPSAVFPAKKYWSAVRMAVNEITERKE